MRKITTIHLAAVVSMLALSQSVIAKDAAAPKAAEAKVCPKELTKAQIGDLMAHKKATIAGHEFQVGAKFDKYAGKRYMNHNKDGKAPDVLALKNEKARGDSVNCMYMYAYKAPSKKDNGKEVERKARIKIFTKTGHGKADAAAKVETAVAEKKS